MLKLLKTIVGASEATVKYPFAPLEVCPGFRGKPELNAQQCIACAACVTACPANALTMETDTQSDTRTWQLYLGRCIYCGRCEEVCPTHAIRLSENFELTVLRKDDLYTRARFTLQRCRVCQRPFTVEKSIALAVALLVQQQKDAASLSLLRQQAAVCPQCKQRAALAGCDGLTLSFSNKEQR